MWLAEVAIATSFHPVRWAVLLAAALPLILFAGFVVFRATENQELARALLRALRFAIAAELVLLVGAAVAGFVYEQHSRRQELSRFQSPGKLIDVGGYRLHLYCTGNNGPTVILEHGHRATYLDWYLVQPDLARFTRVCSFDRAGHGWSDSSPKPRTPDVMSDELHALLSAAGEKAPYILVGHSFGGLEAIVFAHKFPGEVAGVVLVDSPHPNALHRASWQGRLWLRFVQLTMPFGLPRWRGWCDGGPGKTLATRRALTCRPRTVESILREDRAFPAVVSEIQGITSVGRVPLIVIARDPSTGQNSSLEARHAQQQRELAKLAPNSRFIVAEGSGHDVPLARPDLIVDAVRDLVKAPAQADNRGTQ